MVFLVVHALWTLPIWFIAAPGSVVAALGGAGAGWAYHEVRPRFRRPVGAILALLGLQLVAVAPAHALFHRPGNRTKPVVPEWDAFTAAVLPPLLAAWRGELTARDVLMHAQTAATVHVARLGVLRQI